MFGDEDEGGVGDEGEDVEYVPRSIFEE